MNDNRIRVQPVNSLLKRQIIALAVIVLSSYLWQGQYSAVACFYGGLIVVINTLLQRRHLINAAFEAGADAAMNLRRAYRCVWERWIVTVALFLAGFTVLKLLPLPVMAGFILTQLALLFEHKNRA